MLLEILERNNFQTLQRELNESLKHQSLFYRNYMDLFEHLLIFIRASRQQSWQLHLNSLHKIIPYFFAFDQLNYARLMPVYLSQMFELRKKDPKTWDLLQNGHFSVNKSGIPFSAIGADHALEQENRAMKVLYIQFIKFSSGCIK